MWEYIAFQLWEFVGGPLRSDRDWKPADPINDAGGAACLLNARGAESWSWSRSFRSTTPTPAMAPPTSPT